MVCMPGRGESFVFIDNCVFFFLQNNENVPINEDKKFKDEVIFTLIRY